VKLIFCLCKTVKLFEPAKNWVGKLSPGFFARMGSTLKLPPTLPSSTVLITAYFPRQTSATTWRDMSSNSWPASPPPIPWRRSSWLTRRTWAVCCPCFGIILPTRMSPFKIVSEIFTSSLHLQVISSYVRGQKEIPLRTEREKLWHKTVRRKFTEFNSDMGYKMYIRVSLSGRSNI